MLAIMHALRHEWARLLASSSRPASASSGADVALTWRDVYSMAATWRQVAEPTDKVMWSDRYTESGFNKGVISSTPISYGQSLNFKYGAYADRAFVILKQLLLERGVVKAQDGLVEVPLTKAVLRKARKASTHTQLAAAVSQPSFYTPLLIPSSAQPGCALTSVLAPRPIHPIPHQARKASTHTLIPSSAQPGYALTFTSPRPIHPIPHQARKASTHTLLAAAVGQPSFYTPLLIPSSAQPGSLSASPNPQLATTPTPPQSYPSTILPLHNPTPPQSYPSTILPLHNPTPPQSYPSTILPLHNPTPPTPPPPSFPCPCLLSSPLPACPSPS
ncbi:unnamed protein product [Closterium sp. Naga37s-1]|nr:unnamed protein product [Closterium sp. Naga37s-1]